MAPTSSRDLRCPVVKKAGIKNSEGGGYLHRIQEKEGRREGGLERGKEVTPPTRHGAAGVWSSVRPLRPGGASHRTRQRLCLVQALTCCRSSSIQASAALVRLLHLLPLQAEDNPATKLGILLLLLFSEVSILLALNCIDPCKSLPELEITVDISVKRLGGSSCELDLQRHMFGTAESSSLC